MQRTFSGVYTVDRNKRFWPRDLAWQRPIGAMLSSSGIEWSGNDLAYISDSDEGMDLTPETLLIDLTRTEVFEAPSWVDESGKERHRRYTVPRPTNCPLHAEVCKLFGTIYTNLDGSSCRLADMSRPLCSFDAPKCFAGRYLCHVEFYGKNGGRKCFDYDRGWVRRIEWDTKPSWHENIAVATGQIVYTPSLWRRGPGYLNLSSWTSDLTYQFHQVCTTLLSDEIRGLISRGTPTFWLVFFKPGYSAAESQVAKETVVTIAECGLA